MRVGVTGASGLIGSALASALEERGDVVVRFVTKASDRFGQRKVIYEALVGMMEGTERPELGASSTPPQA